MTRKIKAISFDGDMTLWDFIKVMRHSLSLTLEELRRNVPADHAADLTIEKMVEVRNEVAAELKGKFINLENVRFYAFKRTLETIGWPDEALASKLNSFYLKHRFEDIEPYPDVIPSLDILGQNYTLGLLSNGNGYPEQCGLPDRFAFVVFSQDVGVDKPDSKIFFTTCEKAGCKPEELMHVGDSLESDVAGANGVGAVSVWLNRNNEKNDTGIVPDYEICSFSEISGIINSI